MGTTKPCRHCGVPVEQPVSQNRKQCSDCGRKAHAVLRRLWRDRKRAESTPVHAPPCVVCGKPAQRRSGMFNAWYRLTCSDACAKENERRVNRASGLVREQRGANPRPAFPCGWCGVACENPTRRKYCTDECARQAQSHRAREAARRRLAAAGRPIVLPGEPYRCQTCDGLFPRKRQSDRPRFCPGCRVARNRVLQAACRINRRLTDPDKFYRQERDKRARVTERLRTDPAFHNRHLRRMLASKRRNARRQFELELARGIAELAARGVVERPGLD
ncbi:hypothetical protein [Limnoglobus roseus]|uniref:Uncharacterized protein n=1 Tax=Limnoglobus roseus TaxID=2598579 RepID=A0A5C1AMB7_9BACT|nr:hypothetical protein [Limnoglobus roseus]QEL18334.1 hypothetical protein PX52LOC_05355 [Limnoglobus roseus]